MNKKDLELLRATGLNVVVIDENTQFPKTFNLYQETLTLARRFKAEADRLDTIFTQTCDERALQGGAGCVDANLHRDFSRKLFRLAREMELW